MPLFSGTRGVGKTTIARILQNLYYAKKVFLRAHVVNESCLAIDNNNNLDLIEIDAASELR